MKKKIFIIAGEKSGDLLGSKILSKIDKHTFDIYGIGGQLMKDEGLNSIFPMEELSVMGVFEILPKIFNLLKRIKETAKYIIDLQPDIVLTIDSPDFCFRVMKFVKKYDTENKIKKIHFIAPSVWAYRKNRAQKISKIYDLLFCILPFEPPYFEKYGLKTVFVGHPIFDKDSTEYNFNLKENTYNKNSKIISITVGSRIGEVKRLLPIVINVINKLSSKYTFEYNILATEYTYKTINDFLQKQNLNYINVIKDNEEKNNVIKKSLLAIAKSGTNTLELAGFSIPIVVMYKFNFLTNIIAKHIQKKADKKFATIINIINDKQIIPECLLQNCNENNIFNEVVKLIDNEELRINQVQQNIETLKILGYHNNNSSAIKIVNNIEELLNV